MKLHLYAEEITPKRLKSARNIAKGIFGNLKHEIVIHDAFDNVIYHEVITNEEKKEKTEAKT